MDEARLKAYVNLIERLLDCPQGKEMALLQSHPDLMNPELLKVMGQVAQMLRQKGRPNADWLDQIAEHLALLISDHPLHPENSLVFVQQTLQVIISSEGNPQRIYPWLEQHLSYLNPDLLEVLPALEKEALESGQRDSQRMFAMAIGVFSNMLVEFPLGERILNLQCAVSGYEIAERLFQSLEEHKLRVAAQESLAEAQKELQALSKYRANGTDPVV